MALLLDLSLVVLGVGIRDRVIEEEEETGSTKPRGERAVGGGEEEEPWVMVVDEESLLAVSIDWRDGRDMEGPGRSLGRLPSPAPPSLLRCICCCCFSRAAREETGLKSWLPRGGVWVKSGVLLYSQCNAWSLRG